MNESGEASRSAGGGSRKLVKRADKENNSNVKSSGWPKVQLSAQALVNVA